MNPDFCKPASYVEPRDDGGSAFATAMSEGMSIRAHFAGQALPAVIAAYIEANGRCIGTDHVKYNCAAHATQFADALIAELNKP